MNWDALRAMRQRWQAEAPQAGPWSVVEHPLWAGSQDRLRAWAEGGLTPFELDFLGDPRRPSLVMDLGFALLLRLVQVARAECDELSLWPQLADRAFPGLISQQLFSPSGVPKSALYRALKAVFLGMGLRHAFGGGFPQPWELSLRLQFGPTLEGWRTQSFAWLHGGQRPRVLQALLGECPHAESLSSPSVGRLWAALVGQGVLAEGKTWLQEEDQRWVLGLSRKLGSARLVATHEEDDADQAEGADAGALAWAWALGVSEGAVQWALALEEPSALPLAGGQVWVGPHPGPRWWAEGGAVAWSGSSFTWPEPEASFALRWGSHVELVELLPEDGTHRVWDLALGRPVDLDAEQLDPSHDLLVLARPGLRLVLEGGAPKRVAWAPGAAWLLQAPWAPWALMHGGATLAAGVPQRVAKPPSPEPWEELWDQGREVARPGQTIRLTCHTKMRLRQVALGASVAPARELRPGLWEAALTLPARWTRRGLALRVLHEASDGQVRWSASVPWRPSLAEGLALLGPRAWQPWPTEATVPEQALRLGHWWAPQPQPQGHWVVAEGGRPLAKPRAQGPACKPLALGEALAWVEEGDGPKVKRGLLSVGVVDAGLLRDWDGAQGAWRLDRVWPVEALSLQAWGGAGPQDHPLLAGDPPLDAWLHPWSPEVAEGPCLLLGPQGHRLGLHLPGPWPEACLPPQAWPTDAAAAKALATLRLWAFPFQAHPHLMAAWAQSHPLTWLQAFLECPPPKVARGGAAWEADARHRARLWVEAILWAMPEAHWVPHLLRVEPQALADFCVASPAISARAWALLRGQAESQAAEFARVVAWGLSQSPWADAPGEAKGTGGLRAWEAWRSDPAFPHAEFFGEWPWEAALSEGRSWAEQSERASPLWGGPSAHHLALRAQVLGGWLAGVGQAFLG